MASKYYTVSFNSTLYLTKDGTVSGQGCRLSENGISTLAPNYLKTKSVDMRGNVFYNKTQVDKKNRTITLTINSLPKSVGDSLLTLRDDQDTNNTAISMQVTHADFPDYDLDVEIEAINYSEAQFSTWYNVEIIVTTFGEN